MQVMISRPKSSQPGWQNNDDLQHLPYESLRWRIATRPHAWRPSTDVYEIEDAIIVRVEIAGMRESDFTIQLIDRSLQIRGTRQDIPERRSYHQMEIPFGEFSTEIDLLVPVEVERIEATYRDGFLRVLLPKAHPHQVIIGE